MVAAEQVRGTGGDGTVFVVLCADDNGLSADSDAPSECVGLVGIAGDELDLPDPRRRASSYRGQIRRRHPDPRP